MNIKELPDEDLAVFLREVDHAAYREVVERYESQLLNYAKLMLGNEIVAHEVVQDAFISIYENINAFNPKTRFSNFIYRYTHLTLKKVLTRAHQNVGVYEDLSEDFLATDDTENEFIDKELLVHIKNNLHKLPAKYKESLILHFIARKSYDEISEIFQIPVSTVSTRISISRALIKKYAKNK